MPGLKTKRNKSVKYTWFISYMLILAVPLITCFVLCFQMQHNINKERLQQSKMQNESIIKNVEYEVVKNTNTATYLKTNNMVKLAIGQSETYGEEGKAVFEQVSKEIENYKKVYNVNENIYIYFKEPEIIVSPNGIFTPYEFYKANYMQSDLKYSKWKASLNKESDISYNIYSITINASSTATYQNSLHMSLMKDENSASTQVNDRGSRAVIVIQNNNVIFPNTGDKANAEFNYAIFDKSGGLIYYSENFKNSDLFIKQDEDVVNVNGKKYIVSREISDVTEYTYMVAIDYYETLKTQGLYIYIGFMLLSAVFSFILLWYTIRKNYTFIDKLMEVVVKHKESAAVSGNEIELINRTISKIDRENVQYNKLITEQNAQLKANYLSRLLGGTATEIQEIQEGICSENNIEFLSDYFAVVMFYVEDYTAFFENDVEISEQQRINLVKFAIKNVSEEMARMQGNRGYIADMEEISTMIVSFAPENVRKGEQQMQVLCENVQHFLGEQLKIKISAAISRVHSSVFGINPAYKETVAALEYRFVVGEGKIITQSVVENGSRDNYSYTLEREQSLISCIKGGNNVQTTELIEKIFGDFTEKTSPSIRSAQCLSFDIVATLIKILKEAGTQNIDISESDLTNDILSQKSITGIKRAVISVAGVLCDFYAKADNETLEQRVAGYLEANYTRSDLSVNLIAEDFRMHHTYLSNLFKSQAGIGLLEYINRFRIKKSLQMLTETDKNIEEVAVAMGYSGAKTYSRVFKQYMGVTPRQYRDSSANNQGRQH